MTSAGMIAGHLFAVERDLAVAQVQARRRDGKSSATSPAARRSCTARLAVASSSDARRACRPTCGRADREVLPRLIQLVLVVAAGVFPVPHPRRRAGVERAHRHAEIDRRAGAFEPRLHRVRRDRHRRDSAARPAASCGRRIRRASPAGCRRPSCDCRRDPRSALWPRESRTRPGGACDAGVQLVPRLHEGGEFV